MYVSAFVERVCGHTCTETAQSTEEGTDLGDGMVSVLLCIKHGNVSKLFFYKVVLALLPEDCVEIDLI